jgi:GTP pyrophosphokinase
MASSLPNALASVWQRLIQDLDADGRSLLEQGADWMQARLPGPELPTGESVVEHAAQLAALLAELGLDAASRCAALVGPVALPADLAGHPSPLERCFGHDVAVLVQGYLALVRLGELMREGSHASNADQTEMLRKMLLAMATDLRIVFMRLASRLVTMRSCAARKVEPPSWLASETLSLYAPLANRLGIWQLKWELEDLAFRFTDPVRYKEIAGKLEEKRIEREAFIAETRARLEDELKAAGLQAEVSGRPKHLFSIHKKMLNKQLDFARLHDLRAFRVIVPDERSCFQVLGLLHDRWTPVEGEFDDYISRPKPNGYRSLHTVLTDELGRSFEVQIRTPEMHRYAEFGVAAHWRYKEAGVRGGIERADGNYEQRLAGLRQLIAWKAEVEGQGKGKAVNLDGLDDRIYVLTPQARVIDLPRGSTAVDFAYHLHTDLGHRCRGARVDGQLVPLNTPLQTGQTVEVLAAKTGGPSRDWLNPELGYLASQRARSKVRAWFNAIELQQRIATGQAMVEKELQRLGRTAVNLDQLASQLGHARADDLFIAVAKEEVSLRQIDAVFQQPSIEPSEAELTVKLSRPSAPGRTRGDVLVLGVDSLLTQLAKCCRPVPPDAISGFITRGRGVTVHRADCSIYRKLQQQSPERCIEVDWGRLHDARYPVDVLVLAHDRPGLLRDITEVFARERINVTAVNTQSRQQQARMQFTAEIGGGQQLARALQALREVNGVIEATRRTA